MGLPAAPVTAGADAAFSRRLSRTRLAILFAVALCAAAQPNNNDARDLFTRGVQLIPTKPAEAVKLLKDALRIDPELSNLHYELGLALHAIGDEADAEPELQEAVRRAPDSPAVHNDLGIALFNLGDARAAMDEFRAAEKLAPKDPNAHFNLGEAMARSGDSNGAIEELRTASSLAPSDAGLSRLLETVTANTIKVDVKQVLVPVVVTDRDGHHIAGLKQSDFRVFEDGIEQKITAFNVENSVAAAAVAPAAAPDAGEDNQVAATAAKTVHRASVRPRRTYVVLIDALHTTFLHASAARDALLKLFKQERDEEAQYVVISLGVSAEVVLNVTSDPSAVFAAIESKKFQKILADGRIGGIDAEMERFRRDLTETRYACDLAQIDMPMMVKCEAGLRQLSTKPRELGEMERVLTMGFLREFRSIVAQLARARDRRTVVLISDGFPIEPGREAISLFDAYFPFASHCLAPVGFCPQIQLQSNGRMSEEFEPIFKLAAARNVTIDTIDSRGLHGQAAYDASNPGSPREVSGAVDRVERNIAAARGSTLIEIADATGGTAFRDDNDLFKGIARAFADARDYYTIAYVPSNEKDDGKFRTIRVEVANKNASVIAKRGYWAAAQ